MNAVPSWRVLERQLVARALSRAWAKTGKRMAARMAMIAITTSSSISVKPRRRWGNSRGFWVEVGTSTVLSGASASPHDLAWVEDIGKALPDLQALSTFAVAEREIR